MDISPAKLDIDELITEFANGKSLSFADMKKVWLARKFTYIFEASPSTNPAFFMQSLYAHSIGYIAGTGSLSSRLGGLYCLYCLHETQPFKPPFKIYLSIGELKKLSDLVADSKQKDIKATTPLVKRMLEKNVFLFGFVDANESSATEILNQLTESQNACVQVAYKKLFSDTQIDKMLHMDLGMEVDMAAMKKISKEYAEAKKLAIDEGGKVMDVQDIKHISEDDEEALVGDTLEKISGDWNLQRLDFSRKLPEQQPQPQLQPPESFDRELERMLSES